VGGPVEMRSLSGASHTHIEQQGALEHRGLSLDFTTLGTRKQKLVRTLLNTVERPARVVVDYEIGSLFLTHTH